MSPLTLVYLKNYFLVTPLATVDCARDAKVPLDTFPPFALAVELWIRATAFGVIAVVDLLLLMVNS